MTAHFDSEVGMRKNATIAIPQTGFKFLMNKNGKVRTATYQALTWGSSDSNISDVSFYVIEHVSIASATVPAPAPAPRWESVKTATSTRHRTAR